MRAYPVTHIAREVGMTNSTTSHHLQILLRAGLVDVESVGRARNYQFNYDLLRTSILQFRDLIRFMDQALERHQETDDESSED